jgi:O-succinylbenzoic acid--CoA ligase
LYAFIFEWFNDLDYVIGRTSGTTGAPKEMKLSKERMRLSAKRTVGYFELKSNATALLSLSANYIAGKMMIVRALEYMLDLIIIEPSMKALMQLNERIDFAALVPYQVSEIIDKRPSLFADIRKLIIGGAEVSKDLEDKLQSTETACYATYGMTETLSHIALKCLNGNTPDKYYQTMQGIEISQDDRDCLQIVAFGNELLVSNDIVKLHSSNSFEWLGRFDNIINSGGLKFIPEQIEAKIKHLIPNRYIITSQKDDKLGNRIILLIEGDAFNTDKLNTQLSLELTKYEIPKEILFTKHFQETTSGKIIRRLY